MMSLLLFLLNGKKTDNLVKQAKEIINEPSKRELDVLISTGEQITISKLCMCLQKMGYNAISFAGWQVPIITNSNYGDANIIDIKTDNIIKQLNDKKIVIVAGFQGINKDGEITTLGRGGSDTTAVALAVALKAQRCDIYKDVDGIYSEDPNINPNAVKYDIISYEKMMDMSKKGAKVLHSKCIEIAKKNNLPITVKSTFNDVTGTIIK